MKIIIACEHHMLRESIHLLLNSSGTYKLIMDADSEQALLDVVATFPANILVCDSEFPAANLNDLFQSIMKIQPLIKILIFTDSIKQNQIEHQFVAIPSVSIDQPNAGEHLLAVLNQLYNQPHAEVAEASDKKTHTQRVKQFS